MNTPWWRDGMLFFFKASAWIAGPVLLSLIIGYYAEQSWGAPEWVPMALIISAFVLSCIGIVREGIYYMRKAEKEDGESNHTQ